MEGTILQNQQDTLDKIRECEALLKTRVTEVKVATELEALDKKINANIRSVEGRIRDVNSTKLREVGTRIDQRDLISEDKFKEVSALLSRHTKAIEERTKVEDFIELQVKVVAMK
jgi:hypothetical protein